MAVPDVQRLPDNTACRWSQKDTCNLLQPTPHVLLLTIHPTSPKSVPSKDTGIHPIMQHFVLLMWLFAPERPELNRSTPTFNCHLTKCHVAQLEDNRTAFTIQLPDYRGHLYHFNFRSNSVEDKSQTGPLQGCLQQMDPHKRILGVCRWPMACVCVFTRHHHSVAYPT